MLLLSFKDYNIIHMLPFIHSLSHPLSSKKKHGSHITQRVKDSNIIFRGFISILSALPGSSWIMALHLFEKMRDPNDLGSKNNVSWIRSALLQVLANAPMKRGAVNP